VATAPGAPAIDDDAFGSRRQPLLVSPPRALAVFWVAAGVVGWVVSFLLYLEYVGQLTDSEPIVSCTFSVVVSCGPNLLSPGGNLLGFSNSIIGITAFLGPVLAGVGVLAGGAFHRWYWRAFATGVAAAFVLVHVFAWRSVFEYGVLCPWCMIVWLAVIPLFWATLGWALRDGVLGRGPVVRTAGSAISSWLGVVVFVDYLLIAVTAQVRLDVLQSLIR
jgi:uncharacterized membrane protein